MKVLLISKDEKYLDYLKPSLIDLEYQVDIATDSVSGMQIFAKNKPDLVVLGNEPPQVTGLEDLRQVKETRPETLVVIAANQIDPKLACAAVNLHVDAMVDHPVELGDIIAVTMKDGAEVEKRKQKDEQHSRLALEYAKLKQAYEDLRRKM